MRAFAQTAELVASTTKKLQKIAFVAEYFKATPIESAAVSAVFLSGRPFPVWEEATLNVGGASLWRIVEELSGKSESELGKSYRRLGDLGAVAGEILPAAEKSDVSVLEVQKRFREISEARGPVAKSAPVRELFMRVSPIEAKYIIKIMTGDLRIGLKESLVEDAIAKAYGATLKDVQRANMLLGDIAETLRLAAGGRLAEAKMRLFHPLGFMLASPAGDAQEALSYFENALVEDKYDGIRAQAHCSANQVRIFSRTRDDISESFPELADALTGFSQNAILDGEIVAWSYLEDETGGPGRAQPFSALQQRLGRKKVSEKLMQQVPVAYLVFDILLAADELLLDRPLNERCRILDKVLNDVRLQNRSQRSGQATLEFQAEPSVNMTRVLRAPVFCAATPDELDQLFEAAQGRGNEGLMIKDPGSSYTPGRRGKSWLKLKRELATLDVVVTAVEYGHGKRIGVLSDYTFAVWDGDRLVNIGKAYSGLTDAEITEMTKLFLDHTLEDQGMRLLVEPKVVLEVAFNNMMKSDRHNSGYALRFPRIVRLRGDKLPEDADRIERVREIFETQQKS